jgi:hypothetical protein
MPKDPTRNITHYQIQGGHLNEFEFNQSHGEMTEEERERFERREAERLSQAGDDEATLSEGPETESERIHRMMEDARAKAEKNLRRKGKQAAKSSPIGASRKRDAKAAKKSRKGAAKTVAKKTTAKRSAGGAKKRAAGKTAAKKSTRKAGAAGKRSAAKSVGGRGAGKAGAKKSGARRASGKKSRRG